MALAYFNGDLVDRNLTQAYFWILLSQTGGSFRKSNNHLLAMSGNRLVTDESLCFLSVGALTGPQVKLESNLPQEFLHIAQQAASNWKKGQPEPALAAAPFNDPAVSNVPPKAATPQSPSRVDSPREEISRAKPSVVPAVKLPKWVPLAGLNKISGRSDPRNPGEIFKLASKSVWIVVAAQSESDMRTRRNVALGSAVAVTRNQLLTNCHIVENRPLVWIKKAEVVERATVVSADLETDRCILSLGKNILAEPVGFRTYNELRIGEDVYTIGSPSGLETTLGQGIVSGLRQFQGQRLVQTTAQISSGSSGGGLFDKSGNLIGITTFKFGDSEGLNFAIAAEEFFR
jgi:S1-C subfamily serine protease